MAKGKISMRKHYLGGSQPVNALAKKEMERLSQRQRARSSDVVDSKEINKLWKQKK